MCRQLVGLSLWLSLAAGASGQTVLSTQQGFGMDDGAITPNGALAVVRENSALTTARILSMATGQLLASVSSSNGTFSGAAQDAVEVTDTRAVVLGSSILVLDLTNSANPLLAEHFAGFEPRDVAITPDGTMAVVRGGNTSSPFSGGLRVIDLASGALLASHPGEIGDSTSSQYTYSVDSVVATNTHAVCLSLVMNGVEPRTRVTVFELRPTGGGAPAVVYESSGIVAPGQDQLGAPHDLALLPDGQHVAVRSETSIGLYQLSGSSSTRVWHKRLWMHPGPMGFTSMDSVEVSATHIATASRYDDGANFGAQLDLFDLAGNQWHSRVSGDPHDLVFTPDGTRLLVRTHRDINLFGTQNLPAAPGEIQPLASDAALSTNTFYGAGYDSLQATDTRAVAVVRSGASASVLFYRLDASTLQRTTSSTLPEKPTDVALSADARWLCVTGTSLVQVYDFEAQALVLQHDPVVDPIGLYPWCDGAELDGSHLVAWGYSDFQTGWLSVVELFPQAQNFCTSNLNSSGEAARIHANGSASIARDDLLLATVGLPPRAIGFYSYGASQVTTPLGNGTLCVGGQRYFMPIQLSAGGVALRDVQFGGPATLGGAITAGSTWNFQFRFRDPLAGGSQFDLSDAVSISFVP